MQTAIEVLHLASLVLLVIASLLVIWRMAMGPTSLDRSISSDVMVAILTAGVGLWSITRRSEMALPILVVLSLLGFTAAVGMAKLISNRSDQIRTLHEHTHRHEDPTSDSDEVDAWEEDDNGSDS